MKTTNYYNTFIQVAEDCPVKAAEVPPVKGREKTAANLQFELIFDNPYKYSSDDIIFKIYVYKNAISGNLDKEREYFFSKGQPCLRTSPLSKRYGWGLHCNEEGKIALYAMDSEEYRKLIKDNNLKQLKAVRSKRA